MFKFQGTTLPYSEIDCLYALEVSVLTYVLVCSAPIKHQVKATALSAVKGKGVNKTQPLATVGIASARKDAPKVGDELGATVTAG